MLEHRNFMAVPWSAKEERQTLSPSQAPNGFIHPMPTTAAMQLHDCTQDHQSDMQDAMSSGNLKKVVGMNVHASPRCVVEITGGMVP